MNDETRRAYAEILEETGGSKDIETPTVADYQEAFANANRQLKEIDNALNPGGRWGATRNFLRGLVPGESRIEGTIRSIPSGFQDYSEIRDRARQSADEYAAAHPGRAMALATGGALVPSALISALTFGTGSGVGAANTARAAATVANAANTAKKVGTLAKMGRGVLSGGGIGGLYGFMDAPEESIEDRLLRATKSAGVGGVVGGMVPAVGEGLSVLGNFAKNIKATNLRLTPAETEQALLRVTANPSTAKDVEKALTNAVKYGNDDIGYSARNLTQRFANLKNEIKNHNDGLMRSTDPDLYNAIRTPELENASRAYGAFMDANKSLELPRGFAKKHSQPGSYIREIDKDLSTKTAQEMMAARGVEPGTFGAAQEVKSLLGAKTRDLQSSKNSFGAKQAAFEKQKLTDSMEELAPGLKQLDAQYRQALENQTKQIDSRVRTLQKIANVPVDTINAIDPTNAAVAVAGAAAGSPGMASGAGANALAKFFLGRARRGYGNRILTEGLENSSTYRLPTTGVGFVDRYLQTNPTLEALIRSAESGLPTGFSIIESSPTIRYQQD